MNLSEELEIIIPTFNRSKTLIKTLTTILNSPVRNCQITVVDNNSNDDTETCIKELLSQYENLIYIKNKYNLGLAGNICKALTIPEKKYFWIVFDDTGLDFSNWKYVEEGLKQDYDCILTTNYYNVKNQDNYKEKAAIYLMLIYCFAGIYKTELITDEVVLYALTDIYTVHPQMALISTIFNNENNKIFIPQKTITFPQMNPEQKDGKKYSFNRHEGKFYHFRISHGDFIPGFINAIQSIKDKHLQKECIKLLFKKYNNIGPYIREKTVVKQYFNKNNNNLDINYLEEKYYLDNIYSIIKYTPLKIVTTWIKNLFKHNRRIK